MKNNIYTSIIFNLPAHWLATVVFCLALCLSASSDAQPPPPEPEFVFSGQNPFGLVGTDDAIIKLVDIDHDDTLEAFISIDGAGPNVVHYYENSGSNADPDFVFQETGPFGISYPDKRAWQFVDIDGDGLHELFIAGFIQDSPVFMIENTGDASMPNFDSTPEINPYGITIPESTIDGGLLDGVFPTFADIDNDGDYDLFFGGFFNNSPTQLADEAILFMRNNDPSGMGTAPQFDSIEINPFGFVFPDGIGYYWEIFEDLDGDGDLDMYLAGPPDNIYFFENIGSPESPDFTNEGILSIPGQIYSDFIPPAGSFLDIGGDGDMDLIAGSPGTGIWYFENMTIIISVREEKLNVALELAPNPVQDKLQLTIRSEVNFGAVQLGIFDPQGKLVFTSQSETIGNELLEVINVSQLPPGIYFLKIGLDEKMLVQRFVKLD